MTQCACTIPNLTTKCTTSEITTKNNKDHFILFFLYLQSHKGFIALERSNLGKEFHK